MGRYMSFWKYEPDAVHNDENIYAQACEEVGNISGLQTLPTADILAEINRVFSDYDKLDEYNYESGKGAFTVSVTPQTVTFDCVWSMGGDELNKLIDIMLGFGCPFYDPQLSTRFDEGKNC
ncbi:hypothetical protein [uncultured Ruminococcus sp.]|uniref:hypothetical protein n=1 Tax=uncultured Ruminococcus sp. TaxID=165186 RepID=UPI0025F02CC5|nr:hypothetical protein [uncultured Ruminococcus sp.]